QALAEKRIREARVLFAAGELEGAFYLGGYSIECALKAVISKSIPANTLTSPKEMQRAYTHDLEALLRLAELETELSKSTALKTSWTVVKSWNEERRYQSGVDKKTTEDFLKSIDDAVDGILPWLKQHW